MNLSSIALISSFVKVQDCMVAQNSSGSIFSQCPFFIRCSKIVSKGWPITRGSFIFRMVKAALQMILQPSQRKHSYTRQKSSVGRVLLNRVMNHLGVKISNLTFSLFRKFIIAGEYLYISCQRTWFWSSVEEGFLYTQRIFRQVRIEQFMSQKQVSSVRVSRSFMLSWFIPWQYPNSGQTRERAFRTLNRDVLISSAFSSVNVRGISSLISPSMLDFCLIRASYDYLDSVENFLRSTNLGHAFCLIIGGIPFLTLFLTSAGSLNGFSFSISLHFSVLTFSVFNCCCCFSIPSTPLTQDNKLFPVPTPTIDPKQLKLIKL